MIPMQIINFVINIKLINKHIMMIQKLKTLISIVLIGLFITGCAAPGVPHTFINTYEPETLPQIDSTPGTNTISGSAFLRQNGGGVVNCAGNSVVLRKANQFRHRKKRLC